jgi:hypothetical protein
LSQEPEHPALEALRRRAEEEDAAYAEVLAALDRLSSFALPAEAAPEVRERLERLNALWPAPERPGGGGLGGALRRRTWDVVAPAVERQVAFNAALVQLLNAYLVQADGLPRSAGLAGPWHTPSASSLVDARDRGGALATTRSELVLEAFDRRLESLGRRLEGRLRATGGGHVGGGAGGALIARRGPTPGGRRRRLAPPAPSIPPSNPWGS